MSRGHSAILYYDFGGIFLNIAMDRSKYFYIIIEKEIFNIFWMDSKSMGSSLLLTYLEIGYPLSDH